MARDPRFVEDYPSPKEALFGNDHIANAYCAFKWLVWQVAWLGYVTGVGLVVLVLVVFAGPFLLLGMGINLGLERTGGDKYVDAALTRLGRGAVKAGSKTKEMPVTRRIYNECPVTLDVMPKWVKKLDEKF